MLPTDLMNIQRLLREGHAKLAMDHCLMLQKHGPQDPDVWHCLGLGHLQQGQWDQADHFLLQVLQAVGPSPNLLNEIGIVKLRQTAYDEAIDFFSRALDCDPTHSDALNNIAATFNTLERAGKARSYLERLTRVLPFSARVHTQVADNCLALNDVEQAIQYGRKAVRLAPQDSSARLSLGDALEAGGRFKQAKFQYLSVLMRDPGQIGALSSVLALRGTHVAEQHARQAQHLLERGALPEKDRVQLHLGLARYCDHSRAYDLAFDHLQAANNIRFKNHPFDSTLHSQAVDRLIRVFSKDFFESLPPPGVQSRKPLFIVGMPRSGTTLVEQILSSHSRIEAGGELSTIVSIAMQMRHAALAYPEAITALDQTALTHLARQYLDKLDDVSAPADRVTDKMPFNFMHLGLIQVLFPGATIVHCQRDAMDTCVSCLFTTFGESLQFSSNLDALGQYYLDYRRLMSHWRRVLPTPCLDLTYERLVGETHQVVQELLHFCGMDWEPACEQFYQTERGVRTPSRWQVRQPIYGHSVGRWRHYERCLQPLLHVLEPVVREDTVERHSHW
jgi:tetratricopeptide (TPR) repeat protein